MGNVYFVCDVPNDTDAEIEKDRKAPKTEKDCEAPTTEKDCEARETKKANEAALGAAAANTAMEVKHKEGMEVSTPPPPEEDISVWTSILSLIYIFHLVYLCTIHLKLVYFVGSLADQLVRITGNDDDIVSWHMDVFGYMQLGGLLVTPLVGMLFDRDTFTKRTPQQQIDFDNLTEEEKRHKKLKQCIAPIAINITLSIALCVMGLFENLALHIPQYILYTIVRGTLYSSHAAYVSAAFPGKHFGTLLGLGLFSASIAALLNYALFEFTVGVFRGNSLYSNVILLFMVSSAVLHPVNMWRKAR